jgi:ferredoxin-NADP reductase
MTLIARPLPGRLPPLTTVRPAIVPNARLVTREDLSDSLAAFILELDSPLEPYLPGQYVSIGIIDGAGIVQRPYSVVSLDDTRRRVELFIRRIPTGSLSGRLWQLAPGSRVRVGPARGLFTLDRRDHRPRLFIATGTGLAPFLAMLEESVRQRDTVATTLIHGVSYRNELAYGGRLADWMTRGLPLDYRPSVSRPGDPLNAGWSGATGRAEAQIDRLLETGALVAGAATIHLCGNPLMIESCTALLSDAGFPQHDVRVEQFHAPVVNASRV